MLQWEGAPPETAPKSKKEQAKINAQLKADKKASKKAARMDPPGDPEVVAGVTDEGRAAPDEDPTTTPAEVETLQLNGINLAIPRGQLCAIVGPVGCAVFPFGPGCFKGAVLTHAFGNSQERKVESLAGPRWRDEAYQGRGDLWRLGCLLRTAGVDPKRHTQGES